MMNISFDVLGAILGILSLAAAITFYYLGKKEKVPVYLYNRLPIIGTEHSILGGDINIYYKNTLVSELSRTNITIRNIGRDVIRRSDISNLDTLKISFNEETKILSAKIKKTTRDAIHFNIAIIKDNVLEFSFDFLDKTDGALIEIIHDGSSMQKPIITGAIIGAPKGFQNPGERVTNFKKYQLLEPITMILVLALLLIVMDRTFTHMETIIIPIAPSLADSVLGKELLKKATGGDRGAIKEIRKLSGLAISSPADYFEWSLKAMLIIIAVVQLIRIIFLFRKMKYANLMIEL